MNEQERQDKEMAGLQKEAEAWLVRLSSGEATTRDAEAFRDWCARSPRHEEAARRARRLWTLLGSVVESERRNHKDQGSSSVVSAQRAGSHRVGRRAFIGMATAAAAAGFVVVGPTLGWRSVLEESGDYRTATGEQKRVTLSDSVSLDLNTQTRVNRRLASAGGTAIEVLSGEVGVKVRENKRTLIVYAGGGVIEASVARFNVSYWQDEVCVTCIAGSINVDTPGGGKALSAGLQMTYSEQGVGGITRANMEKVTGWQQERLVFDNETLAQVITEINRYRKGRIIILSEQLAQRRVQARIGLDQLDSVISLIKESYGATPMLLPGDIVVFS